MEFDSPRFHNNKNLYDNIIYVSVQKNVSMISWHNWLAHYTFNVGVLGSSPKGVTIHGYGAMVAYGSPKPSMGVRISLPVLIICKVKHLQFVKYEKEI